MLQIMFLQLLIVLLCWDSIVSYKVTKKILCKIESVSIWFNQANHSNLKESLAFSREVLFKWISLYFYSKLKPIGFWFAENLSFLFWSMSLEIYIPSRWGIRCLLFYTTRSIIFRAYRNVTIAGEELQSLGLFSAITTFERDGIFIVPRLLWQRSSFLCGLILRTPL